MSDEDFKTEYNRIFCNEADRNKLAYAAIKKDIKQVEKQDLKEYINAFYDTEDILAMKECAIEEEDYEVCHAIVEIFDKRDKQPLQHFTLMEGGNLLHLLAHSKAEIFNYASETCQPGFFILPGVLYSQLSLAYSKVIGAEIWVVLDFPRL